MVQSSCLPADVCTGGKGRRRKEKIGGSLRGGRRTSAGRRQEHLQYMYVDCVDSFKPGGRTLSSPVNSSQGSTRAIQPCS